MKFRSPAFVLAVTAIALVPWRTHAATAGDAFVCYSAKRSRGQPKIRARAVTVIDERDARDVLVTTPRRLCLPADVGDGVIEPDTALVGYRTRLPKDAASYAPALGVETLSNLGDRYVDIQANPTVLLVPTATDAGVNPPAPDPAVTGVDHYRCHKAKPIDGTTFGPTQQVAIETGASAATVFELTKLSQVCEPVDAQGVPVKNAGNHLACYRSHRTQGQAKYAPLTALHVANQFGVTRLDTRRDVEICLPTRTIDRCNGARALCDRAYDGVAYPTTHNAMSNADDGFLGPNQQYSVTRQLNDGVRGLMLDVWYWNGAVVLCHAADVIPCNVFGMRPLVDGLADIKTFLDQHPGEIVSIIFESYVSEADIAAAFNSSGLIAYVHAQPVGAPWPTLRTLIASDKRLVVFTDDSAASLDWHHYVWDYAWETHYSFEQPSDFSCTINRGGMGNSLFILNHFLTKPLGSPQLAAMVNYNPLFIDRANQCESEGGQLPNFVTVDFYNIGDLFAVVDALNGVAP